MVCNGKTKQHRQIRCSGVPVIQVLVHAFLKVSSSYLCCFFCIKLCVLRQISQIKKKKSEKCGEGDVTFLPAPLSAMDDTRLGKVNLWNLHCLQYSFTK